MIKKICELLENDFTEKAFKLARENNITLEEIWEDDEIIGIAVEDEIVYF